MAVILVVDDERNTRDSIEVILRRETHEVTAMASGEVALDYLATHERLATELGKPLLFEEFGFPRDGESYDPAAATTFRDQYYGLIYGAVDNDWERPFMRDVLGIRDGLSGAAEIEGQAAALS